MKFKKALSVILLAVIVSVTCCSSFLSSASVFYIDGNAAVCPGNTRVYVEEKNYNYAWIDDVVLRDSTSSVTPLVPHPVTDYPYSHTAKEFVTECNNYAALFNASSEILQSSFIKTIKTAYYMLLASGAVKSDQQAMRAYNESRGIVYPYNQSSLTNIYTTLVYALLKSDIASSVLKQTVEIPRGTTVEGAVVIYLSKICNMNVPASVNSIPAFSYLFAEQYVLEGSGLPVSEEPTEQEVYYWVRVLAADKNGYDVPKTTPYAKVTQEQEDYVRYAYYASILTTKYDVHVDPMLLKSAIQSGNKDVEIPKLVLRSMLDSVNTGYSKSEDISSLFEKAKKDGFFDLEDGFYTDIYDYEVTVADTSTEIWFTAFLVADQIADASLSKAKTYINDNLVANTSTNSVKITGNSTKFTVKIEYNDSKRKDTAVYNFTVNKSSAGSKTVGGVNIDLSEPIDNIIGSINDSVSTQIQNNAASQYQGYASGYSGEITTYAANQTASPYASYFETYPTDSQGNVITTGDPLATTTKSEQKPGSVLSNVTQAIEDKPEYIATPIGLLAVGASAGYVFLRKRRNEEAAAENKDLTEVEDIDID